MSGESSPGVWTNQVVERNYTGEVTRNSKRFENEGNQVNDELIVNNELTIISDPFATEHFHQLKYIDWMGALWKIRTATIEYPRIRLTVGGVYDGPTP